MDDLLHRTLGERIELRMALAEDLWWTLCDPNQLENALLNLCINARDAMPDGGLLEIATANRVLDGAAAAELGDLKPGDYVCISVRDSGVGMAPDVAAKAFDPFFTTKPLGQGTGLGLSMIYGFARQSEGIARIASRLGHGTTVSLYLPRRAAEGEEPLAPDPGPAPPDAAAGCSVLVIEDEPVVRGGVVALLRELGCQVLEAGDGESGLALFRAHPVHLVVSDIGLPGMDGRQVADAVLAERPQTKVLLMTGYAQAAALAGGFLAPGMQLITKPFPMDVLAGRVRDMLRRD